MQEFHNKNLEFKSDTPILMMEHLCKNYQLGKVQLQVLRDIDLAITGGEYVAIIGPSGSGKSTLLNMIGCLDRPTSGQYWLGGQEVCRLDDDRLSLIRGAHIGFIFQSFNLIAQLNVVENIEIPMYYQGFSEEKSAERAMELAAMVGLGGKKCSRKTHRRSTQAEAACLLTLHRLRPQSHPPISPRNSRSGYRGQLTHQPGY